MSYLILTTVIVLSLSGCAEMAQSYGKHLRASDAEEIALLEGSNSFIFGTVSLSRKPNESDWPLHARGCYFLGKNDKEWGTYSRTVYFLPDNNYERGIFVIPMEAGTESLEGLLCWDDTKRNDHPSDPLGKFTMGVHDTISVNPQEAVYVGHIRVDIFGRTNGHVQLEENISNQLEEDTVLLKQIYGNVDTHNIRIRLLHEDQLKAQGLFEEAIKGK